jgi:predicted transglutaminase-like cysteine proteinase
MPPAAHVAVRYSTNIPDSEKKRTLSRIFARFLLVACFPAWLGAALADLDFTSLQAQLIARFGPARAALLQDWQAQLAELQKQPEADKLARINDFFNRNVEFAEDITVWNQTDYWATPLETIGRGRGDCEDFAIVKYYSLKQVGVAAAKLRLVYVKANQGGNQRAHMVLAYYASPTAEPLVLDNLDAAIKPASRRPDLTPVFSFNSQGVYAGVAGNAASSGGSGRLSRWEDLMRRARSEGFE